MKEAQIRWVVVTGAASGIGDGVCHALADAGYGIIMADIDATKLAEAATGVPYSRTLLLDVTDPSAKEKLAKIAEETGNVWGLVNCAGISLVKHFLLNTEEEWTRILRTNLEGTIRACSAIAPVLHDNGGGAIINVASITGRNPAALQGAYAASKAGVIGFSTSLAFDLGPLNVTVNAVCPGIVRTPIWDRILEKEAGETGQSADAIFARHTEPIPMGRPQSAQEIGQLCVFLLSDAARSISGEAINITGGMTFVDFDFNTAAAQLATR
jgi:meso-butanediol dehydrogenase / (S,S)-butanediol dehydrogenase / diacetyl reductase